MGRFRLSLKKQKEMSFLSNMFGKKPQQTNTPAPKSSQQPQPQSKPPQVFKPEPAPQQQIPVQQQQQSIPTSTSTGTSKPKGMFSNMKVKKEVPAQVQEEPQQISNLPSDSQVQEQLSQQYQQQQEYQPPPVVENKSPGSAFANDWADDPQEPVQVKKQGLGNFNRFKKTQNTEEQPPQPQVVAEVQPSPAKIDHPQEQPQYQGQDEGNSNQDEIQTYYSQSYSANYSSSYADEANKSDYGQHEEQHEIHEEKVVTPEPPKQEEVNPPQETKPSAGGFSKFKRKQQEPKSEEKAQDVQRQKYSEIVAELQEFENKLYGKFARIYINQSIGEQRRVEYQQSIVQLRGQISKLQAEQQAASAQDDFDKAAELESNIDQMKEQIEEIERDLSQLNEELITLGEHKKNLRQQESPHYSNLIQKITQVEAIQTQYIQDFSHEQQSALKKQLDSIEAERERLKISQTSIERDSVHLDEEEENLKTLMNNQTKDLRIELNELSATQFGLEREIEELMRILKQKQQELDQIIDEQESLNNKILVIEKKFSQQLKKVDLKREKFQEEIEQLQKENGQIRILQQDYDSKQEQLSNTLNQLSQQLKDIISKKEFLIGKQSTLQDDIDLEGQVNEAYQVESLKTQTSLNALQAVEVQISDISYQKNLNQSEIQEQLNQKNNYSQKLPGLIEQKNTLRAQKQFLLAKTVNEQIIEAQSQVEKADAKIQMGLELDNEYSQQLTELNQEREQLNQVYQQDLARSEFHKYFVLEIRVKDMKNLLPFISNSDDKERLSDLIRALDEEKQELYVKYRSQIEEAQAEVEEQPVQQLNGEEDQQLEQQEEHQEYPEVPAIGEEAVQPLEDAEEETNE